jgi:hypothetical protein
MKMGQTVENPTYELDLGDGVEGVEVNIDGNDANLVETSVTAGLGSDAEGQPVDESAKEEKPAAQADQKDGEELKDYSESVKKRIDKLTSKLREAERREQAAIEFAQGVQQKFLTAEQSVAKANFERLGEAKSRVETQMMTIKQIIKKAREEGDIDTETEAQERLMSLMHEQREIGQYLDQPQRSVQQPPAQPQQFQQQPQFQQPVQQAARPDSKAEEWAEQNPWFGQDYAMTYAAWGIDKQLREAEGFDGSSDEYYDELNRRIRGQFPQKFAAQTNRAPKQNVQAVAPAARSSGVNNSARRSVKLSPSQVAIAKKLGVPVEEYAKYVKE